MAERWSAPGDGERYAGERWRSVRARGRDPRLVRRLLRAAELPAGARVLDVPCGAGRLAGALGERAVGVDASAQMLEAARARGAGPLALADAARLPFVDGTFDAVVCCRLLHHLTARLPGGAAGEPAREPGRAAADEPVRGPPGGPVHRPGGPTLERVVAELVRVSRRWVVASFWDQASWHAWRRRLGLRAAGPRAATSRARMVAALDAAGADARGWAHSFRFVSPQAFVLAEKR